MHTYIIYFPRHLTSHKECIYDWKYMDMQTHHENHCSETPPLHHIHGCCRSVHSPANSCEYKHTPWPPKYHFTLSTLHTIQMLAVMANQWCFVLYMRSNSEKLCKKNIGSVDFLPRWTWKHNLKFSLLWWILMFLLSHSPHISSLLHSTMLAISTSFLDHCHPSNLIETLLLFFLSHNLNFGPGQLP